MDEHCATLFNALLDIPVGDSEEFLNILLCIIVDVDITVFEELTSFCVLFRGYVEDVGDAGFYHAAGLAA